MPAQISVTDIMAEGSLEVGLHYQVRKVLGVDPLPEVFQMLNNAPYPTQQQIDAWTISAQTKADSKATTTASYQSQIISMDTIFKDVLQFASQIDLVFNQMIVAERASKNADNTFTDICGAGGLNNASVPAGFRNLVNAAFTAQSGLTIDFANIAGVPLATRQNFNGFIKSMLTRWQMMAYLGRIKS